MFLNDVLREVKDLKLGIKNIFAQEIISILPFADDIVIFAESETDLKTILICIENWCKKSRLKVNTGKTNLLQFMKRKRGKTVFEFMFDNTESNIVDRYKYLGTILNEHLDFLVKSSVLSEAADRALGAVISKFKGLTNVGFNTFDKMYHSSVVTIIDYGSGIWGYKQYGDGDKIQFTAIQYVLGVHSKLHC